MHLEEQEIPAHFMKWAGISFFSASRKACAERSFASVFGLAGVVLVAVLRFVVFLVLRLGGVLALSLVVLLVLGGVIVLLVIHVECPFTQSSVARPFGHNDSMRRIAGKYSCEKSNKKYFQLEQNVLYFWRVNTR